MSARPAEAPRPLARTPEEWSERLREWGEPAYRGAQVFRWIHQRGVFDPAAMTDLPKRLRARLEEEGLGLPLTVDESHASADGTHKLVLRLDDGRRIESVLIPQGAGIDDPLSPGGAERPEELILTQCISSQVGCAMACVFCASGMAGLKRNLRADEIVAQVLLGRAEAGEGGRLRNVVFMGMGEPLHNYDAVARALRLFFHADGLNLSRRRVTLSTSGLVPEMDRLGRDFEGQVQLAVSLHVPDDERRSALMPINRKYPLAEVVEAMRRYPMPPRRRITIEYTLVKGYNDALSDADALTRLLRGIRAKVNLIPMNPIDDSPLGPPPWSTVEAFHDRLWDKHLPAFVRRRKGDDIAAACGQLALGEPRKVRVALPLVAER